MQKSSFLVTAILAATCFLVQPANAQLIFENLTRADNSTITLAKDSCECETADCTFKASELTATLRIETFNTMDRVEYWNDTEKGELEPRVVQTATDNKVWIVEIGYGADMIVARGDTETFFLTVRAYQTNGSNLDYTVDWSLTCGPTTRTAKTGLVVSEAEAAETAILVSKPSTSTFLPSTPPTSATSDENPTIEDTDFRAVDREDMAVAWDHSREAAEAMFDQVVEYLANLEIVW